MSAIADVHDLAGVIHVHSLYSDGTGTVPEIAAAAEARGLDYVLLTDHDTLRAKDCGEEGWHGSVLVLVGEEVSPAGENHYLAFGLDRPIRHRGLGCQQIVDRVNEEGGFGFLSHPFSKGSERFRRARGMPWRDLDANGYTGVELWSFVTDSAEKIGGIADVLRFIAMPQHFVDNPPRHNLEQWDRLCARRRCVGLGGVDAHQIGIRIGNRVPLRLMAYKRSFGFLRTHLLAERPLSGDVAHDRDIVYSTLRAGRAYIAMDALAPARGFRFDADGERPLTIGDEAPARGPSLLRTELPRPARVRLMRDGEEVASAENATVLEHETDRPGVYRVEAYLRTHGRERTWILSNPIYFRRLDRAGAGE
jgi:hypothetical protein